jgi:putative SOS response-associated peptidase YedK
MAPVIFMGNQQPEMKLMRWGLIPSWAKDESTGNALINARVETLKHPGGISAGVSGASVSGSY